MVRLTREIDLFVGNPIPSSLKASPWRCNRVGYCGQIVPDSSNAGTVLRGPRWAGLFQRLAPPIRDQDTIDVDSLGARDLAAQRRLMCAVGRRFPTSLSFCVGLSGKTKPLPISLTATHWVSRPSKPDELEPQASNASTGRDHMR